MSPDRPVLLSKSRFLAGLQCLKRLYLECYHRELADPVDASHQAIFDTGHTVGALARQRFPGGALVEERFFEHAQAEYRTQALLRDPSVPALYEPAFSFAGVRTRIDVLLRTSGRAFDLIEVKSTASAKDEHIPDVAIQTHVVEGYGISVGRAYLMHLNTAYVYRGGDHDLTRLFSLRDVTAEVREYSSEPMLDELFQMWEALRQADTLNVETGRHCVRPYVCPFFGHCHRDDPTHPIGELPGLMPRAEERLRASGISGVADIPCDFPRLSGLQRRVRESVVTGQPFLGEGLRERLGEIVSPASFPVYVGTQPFQTLPFQWSLHVRESDGSLRHRAFLAEGADDPREELVVSLLQAVPDQGTIVAYSNYERTDSERGRRLLVHPNLHAKYYRADRRCLIGSANVTRRGLGWASPSNVELLVEISSEQTGIMDWETALLSSAIEATPELQTQIQLRADEIRSQRVIARPPEVDSIREEAQPTTRWVPRCSMPDVLWEVYAGGESGQRLLEGTRVASNQDLEALGPPRGLSKALFEAYVTTIMKRMPLIVEIDDRAIHGLTDTGAHEFLTDYLGDELPYSPQETWGIINRLRKNRFCWFDVTDLASGQCLRVGRKAV